MERLGDDELLGLTPRRPETFAVFYRRRLGLPPLVLEDEALERVARLGGTPALRTCSPASLPRRRRRFVRT